MYRSSSNRSISICEIWYDSRSRRMEEEYGDVFCLDGDCGIRDMLKRRGGKIKKNTKKYVYAFGQSKLHVA